MSYNFDMPEAFPKKEAAPIEVISIDENELRQLATDLYERHRDEILAYSLKTFGKSSIPQAVEQIPPEILQNYDGHGVTRGDDVTNIAAAVSMLKHSAFIGWSAKLAKSGWQQKAWTNGDFLAISRKGEELSPRPNQQAQHVTFKLSSGETRDGLHMDLGALVVNECLESIIPELRMMFPKAKIISSSELQDYINEQESGTRNEGIGEAALNLQERLEEG